MYRTRVEVAQQNDTTMHKRSDPELQILSTNLNKLRNIVEKQNREIIRLKRELDDLRIRVYNTR